MNAKAWFYSQSFVSGGLDRKLAVLDAEIAKVEERGKQADAAPKVDYYPLNEFTGANFWEEEEEL